MRRRQREERRRRRQREEEAAAPPAWGVSLSASSSGATADGRQREEAAAAEEHMAVVRAAAAALAQARLSQIAQSPFVVVVSEFSVVRALDDVFWSDEVAPLEVFVNPCVLTFLSTQFAPPISELRGLAPEDGGLLRR